MTSILESPPVKFDYPDIGLLRHLVDCYFDNLNILLPLLHRPSFMRSVEEGTHHIDHNFGAIILLVCAIGCRYTKDPRVTHEVTTSTSSTAWRFFIQLNKRKHVHYLPHSLYEAQIYPVRFPDPFRHYLIKTTKAGCALSGGIFASRDTLGCHRSGSESHAGQWRPPEILLGKAVPGERTVEASILVGGPL